MVNVRGIVASVAIAIAMVSATIDHDATIAIAAPIPTPAPGTAQPLPQPTPANPVQYIVGPGQIGSSAAQNSNFYKMYGDLSGVINALNGCNYIPGAAIGAISAVSPLNVSISTCSSGSGTGATATLSLTGVVPQANLPNAPTFSGGVAANTLSSNSGRVDVAGDIGTAQGASSGRVFFGQSTTAKTIDYGVTTASTFSISAATTVYGLLEAYQSSTQGVVLFGNLGAGGLDYNFCNTSAFSFTTQPCSGTYRGIDAGTYSNLSDRRVKKNITPITDGLRAIARLRPVSFRWRTDSHRDIGFIAQDVAHVLPTLVHRDRRGSYLLNYSGIIPVLVRAVQEQQSEIADLRRQLAARSK